MAAERVDDQHVARQRVANGELRGEQRVAERVRIEGARAPSRRREATRREQQRAAGGQHVRCNCVRQAGAKTRDVRQVAPASEATSL